MNDINNDALNDDLYFSDEYVRPPLSLPLQSGSQRHMEAKKREKQISKEISNFQPDTKFSEECNLLYR